MASIFSLTLFKPQVAMAVSHLPCLGSSAGARALSSLPHLKSPACKTDKKAKHSAKFAVIPETLTEVERVRRPGPRQTWVESHTSAQSFFENKTGFPHHQLESPPPPALPSPSTLRQALLSYTHALRSVQYSQRRGLKTEGSEKQAAAEAEENKKAGSWIDFAISALAFILFGLIFICFLVAVFIMGGYLIPDEETNRITAYHEAGHMLVAYLTPDAPPLHKVRIIPWVGASRCLDRSLRRTSFKTYKTVSHLRAKMDVGFGGRAAEEVIFGPDKVTTGTFYQSKDLKMSTYVATDMVKYNGMSDKVGLRVPADLSPAQRETIDAEIERILQESYERAKAILTKHNAELHSLAKALMKYETLDTRRVRMVCEGKTLNR